MAYAIGAMTKLVHDSATAEAMSDGNPLNNYYVGGLLAGIEILAMEIQREIEGPSGKWLYTGDHHAIDD